MKTILFLKLFTLSFLTLIASPVWGAEKTYTVTEPSQIREILNGLSCLNLILHGEGTSHPVQSALLAGWKIGRLEISDNDTTVFNWPVNQHDYKVKRSVKMFFYGNDPAPKLVLKAKPCGAEAVDAEKSPFDIWEKDE